MSEEIEVTVARLEERIANMQEKDVEVSSKLDALLGQLIKSNADREADLIFLKHSIKRKISDSISELKQCHDNDLTLIKKVTDDNKKDLDKLKETYDYLKLWAWLGKNKKVLYTFCLIVLVTFIEKIPVIYHVILKKFGL